MGTTMRFVLLADERAGSAFNRFADKVDRANGAMGRNEAALKRQAKASQAAQGSMLALSGTVSGFDHAFKIASPKVSMFGKVLAGVNLATGVLEPALAGLIVTTGALAAASAAAVAGAGAYGLALKSAIAPVTKLMAAQKLATTQAATAQASYQNALASGVKPATALANKQLALAASQRQLTLAQKQAGAPARQLAAGLTAAKKTYDSWGASLARPVLAPLTTALRFVRPALRAMSPLVRAAAGAFKVLVTEMGVRIQAGGLRSIVQTLLPHVQPVILNLAHAIGNIAAGIWGIVKAFLPMSDTITGGVAKLTARFKEWGSSLPSHSGFQSLMAMFRGQTPGANAVLKNLAIIIKNVARAMVGLASPANSKALIQILTPLSQIMVRLTANQGLVRAVLYFLLMKTALSQATRPLKEVSAGIGALSAGASKIRSAYMFVGSMASGFRSAAAAESAFSGAAGTLGGKLRTVVDAVISAGGSVITYGKGLIALGRAEGIAAVMSRVLGTAMKAMPWVAIAAAVIALAYVVIKYHKQIWAFVKKAWGWILDWIKRIWGVLVMLFRNFTIAGLIISHWRGIWEFTKKVWGWILDGIRRAWGVLVMLFRNFTIAGLIISHWNTIKNVTLRVWNSISGFFSRFWDNTTRGFRNAVSGIAGAWAKVKNAAETPVRFIVNVVYMKGIRPIVNAVAGLVGLHLPAIKMRRGGRIPGYGGGDKIPAWVRGAGPALIERGETIVSKEHSRALGPVFSRIGVPGYARGGIPNPLTAIGHGLKDIGHFFRNMAGRALASAAKHFLDPLLHAIPGGGTKLGRGLIGIPKRIVSAVISALLGTGSGGAGASSIVRYAESFIGKVPYLWGGTTPAGWDCSGFTGWVYKHAGYKSIPRTSQQQATWVKRAQPQPGALAFFAGSDGTSSAPGHVGIIVGANKMANAFGTGFGTRYNNLSGMLFAGIPPGGFRDRAGRSPGAAQAWMRSHLGDYRWGPGQWPPLKALWTGESGWRWNAANPSGAYGIPQALPGSKMASAGRDWRTNPATQMRWGAGYIRSTPGYGTPAAAYSKWLGRSPHWYGKGGPILEPVAGIGLRSGARYSFGEGGATEYVSSQADLATTARLLSAVLKELRELNGHAASAPARTGREVTRGLNGLRIPVPRPRGG